MNQHRPLEELRDDLGVELEQLLVIEPSPDLAARVRERVAGERAGTWWPLRWQLAGVAAVVTVLATIVAAPFRERVTAPLPVVPASNAPAITIPIVPLDVALSLEPRARALANRTAPPRSRSARATTPHYPVLVMPPLEPLTQISIEPVAIEPLSAIAPLSGEHQ